MTPLPKIDNGLAIVRGRLKRPQLAISNAGVPAGRLSLLWERGSRQGVPDRQNLDPAGANAG
jgi:hypothetical protein